MCKKNLLGIFVLRVYEIPMKLNISHNQNIFIKKEKKKNLSISCQGSPTHHMFLFNTGAFLRDGFRKVQVLRRGYTPVSILVRAGIRFGDS